MHRPHRHREERIKGKRKDNDYTMKHEKLS